MSNFHDSSIRPKKYEAPTEVIFNSETIQYLVENASVTDIEASIKSLASLHNPNWVTEEVMHLNGESFEKVDITATMLPSSVWSRPGPECPFRTTFADAPQKSVKIAQLK